MFDKYLKKADKLDYDLTPIGNSYKHPFLKATSVIFCSGVMMERERLVELINKEKKNNKTQTNKTIYNQGFDDAINTILDIIERG